MKTLLVFLNCFCRKCILKHIKYILFWCCLSCFKFILKLLNFSLLVKIVLHGPREARFCYFIIETVFTVFSIIENHETHRKTISKTPTFSLKRCNVRVTQLQGLEVPHLLHNSLVKHLHLHCGNCKTIFNALELYLQSENFSTCLSTWN